MHFYSYNMGDPICRVAGYALSVQIVTLENIYGLAPDALSVRETETGGVLECGALRFAGGQERAEGTVRVTAQRRPDGLIFRVQAAMQQKIKCIKLLLRGLPDGHYCDLLGKREAFPREGVVRKYPLWMRLPLLGLCFSDASGVLGVSARREWVGTYRFALYSEEQLWSGTEGFVLELIHEQDADRLDCRMQTCDWMLHTAADWDGCVEDYLGFAEQRLGLTRWEQRQDVPDWLRDIQLCVTLHGMHWSGYRFLPALSRTARSHGGLRPVCRRGMLVDRDAAQSCKKLGDVPCRAVGGPEDGRAGGLYLRMEGQWRRGPSGSGPSGLCDVRGKLLGRGLRERRGTFPQRTGADRRGL